MATFTTSKNPNLVILRPSFVQFVASSFTTEDPIVIGVLRSIIAGNNDSGIAETVAEANATVDAGATTDKAADILNTQNLLDQTQGY